MRRGCTHIHSHVHICMYANTRSLGYVSDLAQSRRPTPSHKRESKGVAAHNAFPGRRRQGRREQLEEKEEEEEKEKNAPRRKATNDIRVSRAVRGSQYP